MFGINYSVTYISRRNHWQMNAIINVFVAEKERYRYWPAALGT